MPGLEERANKRRRDDKSDEKTQQHHEWKRLDGCVNNLATALLTDCYQITMAYAHWKNARHDAIASFDVLFRKNPFEGEFTVFAGVEEALKFVSNFGFARRDVEYLKRQPFARGMDAKFFDEYLMGLDCSEVVVEANLEGSVVFPRVPLLHVTGPMGVTQLLETTLLTMINYASLVATNAARHRLRVGEGCELMEFGLRRAQGIDGGVSASRYAYMGGFDATSNCEAGRQFGIPVKGTHAHSFVQAHSRWGDVRDKTLKIIRPDGEEKEKGGKEVEEDFGKLASDCLERLKEAVADKNGLHFGETNESELISFCVYALAFPNSFLALIDTYDTLKSGLPNYVAVALALRKCGYKPIGVRIDSGDLSYLSLTIRNFLRESEKVLLNDKDMQFAKGLADEWTKITASNDINETVLRELKQSGNSIDAFGIGTHLVTCMAQPALGCVYKLVEIDEKPRIKVSEDIEKVTIPGKKQCFRLYGKIGNEPIVDVMIRENENTPKAGERFLCRHPFLEGKRAYVTPAKVEKLLHVAWDGKKGGVPESYFKNLGLETARNRVKLEVKTLRSDHLRYTNPTPYKVSVSPGLYDYTHKLWLESLPARELT